MVFVEITPDHQAVPATLSIPNAPVPTPVPTVNSLTYFTCNFGVCSSIITFLISSFINTSTRKFMISASHIGNTVLPKCKYS